MLGGDVRCDTPHCSRRIPVREGGGQLFFLLSALGIKARFVNHHPLRFPIKMAAISHSYTTTFFHPQHKAVQRRKNGRVKKSSDVIWKECIVGGRDRVVAPAIGRRRLKPLASWSLHWFQTRMENLSSRNEKLRLVFLQA